MTITPRIIAAIGAAILAVIVLLNDGDVARQIVLLAVAAIVLAVGLVVS